MHCATCYKFSKENGKPPLCKRPGRECPVEDCATDPRIEYAIAQFIKAKGLGSFPYAAELQKQLLERGGFMDDPDLLYACEQIYLEYEIEKKRENGR